MLVSFLRTGERRYGVTLQRHGHAPQSFDPAPGFDPFIPHDLIHYLVEAELRLDAGVFGRAADGGGTFILREATTPRALARQRRKQQRKERSLQHDDAQRAQQMATSERLAAVCDLLWRRRHGQTPDHGRRPSEIAAGDDQAAVLRVVDHLDRLAPRWNTLPVGGALVFTWPSVEASVALPREAD